MILHFNVTIITISKIKYMECKVYEKKMGKRGGRRRVIGCLLAGCASAKPAHLDGLDKLGAIEVVTREEGSGTRSTFAEKAGIVDAATGMDQTTKDSVAAAGNEDVLQKVEKDPNAIGYISSAIAGQSDQVHEVTLTKKNLSRNFYLTYTGNFPMRKKILSVISGVPDRTLLQIHILRWQNLQPFCRTRQKERS